MTGVRVNVATLRHAAQAAVAARSLRAVADDIGMSWSGLRSFLAGANPHPDTIAKLLAWRGGARKGRMPSLSRADMLVTVEVLADYIEGADSPEGKLRRLRTAMDALAERTGLEVATLLKAMTRTAR